MLTSPKPTEIEFTDEELKAMAAIEPTKRHNEKIDAFILKIGHTRNWTAIRDAVYKLLIVVGCHLFIFII